MAVHALVYLNHKQTTLSSEELAENICTNPARVRKVMALLKKDALVSTREGGAGGYAFLLDPASVTLKRVADAVHARFVSAGWHSGDTDMECLVASGMADIMDGIYGELDGLCRARLNDMTIQDIDGIIFGDDALKERKKNMKELYYDAVIIGFGKGGKTLAGKLAGAGRRVAMVEMDSGMYGGTCINVGCIPSKSLVVSATRAPGTWDAQCAHYRRAIEEKRRLTAMLRQKNFDKLDQNPNVTIYNGTARFAAHMEVEVSCRDENLLLTAGKIFINTGATPRIPPIQGLETTAGVYTSTSLMELESLPKHLIILGGGYIGLEFASMFAAFGSRVTVVQDGATFLPKEDEDIAAEIRSLLEAQGVTFCLGETPEKVEAGPTVVLRKGEVTRRLTGDALLVATGRIPNTAGLNCEAAGITLTARGAVQVDELLRTTAPNIWAMGDVTGGLQHTYVSLDDSRIVWGQLSGESAHTAAQRKNVPYSVFLKTPYSRVGLNEREARAAGYRVKVAKIQVAAIPKAQVLKSTHGVLKAIIDQDSCKILGVMLLCEASYEMVNVVKLAMDFGADYTVLRDQTFTHPTMTEALNDLFCV